MASKLPNSRLGVQVADGAGNTQEGEARYTSWAKDASLPSEIATDLDRFDPHAVRVGLDVESTVPLEDLRPNWTLTQLFMAWTHHRMSIWTHPGLCLFTH